MPLSKSTIQELKHILKDEYGRDLSLREASEIANGLVGYFDALARINSNAENNYEPTKWSKDT